MKNKLFKHYSLLAVGFAILFTSCVKKPSANFTASKTTVNTGDQIAFTNTSSNAVSYSWDFGDGTTSTVASPSKSYTQKGNYTVTLTVYTKHQKKSATKTLSISVDDSPSVYEFTGTIGGVAVSIITDGIDIEVTNGNGNTINTTGGLSTINYGSAIDNVNTQTNWLNIQIGTLSYSNGSIPSKSQFDAFITAKSYSYSVNYVNGIEISYGDANGVIWSTSKGSGGQSGSTFTITQATSIAAGGQDNIEFKANFSCILYNDAGQTLALTGGYFYGAFGNF